MKISNSKIKTARRCMKAYEYKYIQKLRRRLKSRPLMVGSLIHSCLELYFRKGHYTPAIREWREKEFNRMFKEEQSLHADIIPMVKALMRGYIKSWEESGLTMVWVEKKFEIKLTKDITLVLIVDGVAECDKGRRWLVEHKTCKNMPGEEVRTWDTQGILYNKALNDYTDEENVSGIIWDYIRKKSPTKPKLLAKGGLSQAKSIDTTPEVYRAEIKKHGLDPRGYSDILKELEDKRDNFYRRIKLPFNNHMATQVMEDAIATGEKLITWHEERPHFERNLTRDCSWCDYKTLCHAELRGDDVEFILKHDYEVKDEEDSFEINPEEG